ncbi:MAG TPA: tetratricopeptide repeat protein [Thermodesulfovibrionales bacterium]|nr:tetratricopeptide repeat protein [Thermodesulfovibrionales bacterium]
MPDPEGEKLFAAGLKALAAHNTLTALVFFEKAVAKEDMPIYSSHMAYCIAKERGQFQLAVTLCEKAIARDPKTPSHYLHLGRIYLLAGKKSEAVRTYREGLAFERDQELIEELDRLETRKSPVLSFLKRDNPINRILGIVLRKSGFR